MLLPKSLIGNLGPGYCTINCRIFHILVMLDAFFPRATSANGFYIADIELMH